MKIYITSIISIVLLTCMVAVVGAADFNLYTESSLDDYDTTGYSDWERLKSTNSMAFVNRYFELMNMSTGSLDILRRSKLLKYKAFVFRDFSMSDTLIGRSDVWLNAVALLIDIRNVYRMSQELDKNSILGDVSMTNIIAYSESRRIHKRISLEMIAAENFIKSKVIENVTRNKNVFPVERIQEITNILDRLSFTKEDNDYIKNYIERINDKNLHGAKNIMIQSL